MPERTPSRRASRAGSTKSLRFSAGGAGLLGACSDYSDTLLEDIFVIAMQRIASLRDSGAFGGWLAAIARNRAADQLRRMPQTVELTDDVGRMDPDRTEALTVLATIQTLPDAYRETLVLRLVEGMTGPEIAARTGLTPASVRVNLHRGMRQLRERLGVLA